ncbi:MAG: hypothetical protein M1828_001540 [Chrysothrix sp. TS-e1954]|nr:MAG: hypothetical protein M1828_001540 [Chrysothrix sp. TS-e1954]
MKVPASISVLLYISLAAAAAAAAATVSREQPQDPSLRLQTVKEAGLPSQLEQDEAARGMLHEIGKRTTPVDALIRETKHSEARLGSSVHEQFTNNRINYYDPGVGAFAYAKFGDNADIVPMLRDSQTFLDPRPGKASEEAPKLMQVQHPVVVEKLPILVSRDNSTSQGNGTKITGTAKYGTGVCINCNVHYTINLNNCSNCCRTCETHVAATSTPSPTSSNCTTIAGTPKPSSKPVYPVNATIYSPAVLTSATTVLKTITSKVTLACPACPGGLTTKQVYLTTPCPTSVMGTAVTTLLQPKSTTTWTTKTLTQTIQCPSCPGKVATVVKTTSSPCPVSTPVAPPYQNTSVYTPHVASVLYTIPAVNTSVVMPSLASVPPSVASTAAMASTPVVVSSIAPAVSAPAPMSSAVVSVASSLAVATPSSSSAVVSVASSVAVATPSSSSAVVSVASSLAVATPSSSPAASPALTVSTIASQLVSVPPAVSVTPLVQPPVSLAVSTMSESPVSQLSDNRVAVPNVTRTAAPPSAVTTTPVAPEAPAATSVASAGTASGFVKANGAGSSVPASVTQALVAFLAAIALAI